MLRDEWMEKMAPFILGLVCAFPQNQSSIGWFSFSLAHKFEIARRYF